MTILLYALLSLASYSHGCEAFSMPADAEIKYSTAPSSLGSAISIDASGHAVMNNLDIDADDYVAKTGGSHDW